MAWNATEKSFGSSTSILPWIEDQVIHRPTLPAVIFEDQTLSYAMLDARANQLAHYLRAQGIKAETLIGVCMERSLEMVIALLGILKAGCAYVPIDPGYPQERVHFMLTDSQVPLLLTQDHLCSSVIDKLPAVHALSTLCLDSQWSLIAEFPTRSPNADIHGKQAAYMIYTSGSTGTPKGAVNTHEGLCNRLLWMQEAYHLSKEDRVLQKTPFSFDVSVWEFFWPLMTGACLVVARPEGHRDSAYLVEVITQQQITTLHFVPSMLRLFLQAPGIERCTSLRRVICSGEALPQDVQGLFFQRLSAGLYNLYGPTEAAIDVTHWTCQVNSNLRTVPIGRPIANTQIYLLDEQMRQVPIGEAAELYIGGIGVARGYWQRPALTAERFVPDPFARHAGARLYRTGDIARFLPDGAIEYLGRADFQVKIRGFRIELGEIEAALVNYPAIREATVVAREDTPGSPRLVAYVILHQGHTLDIQAIRERLQKRLPDYMVPAAYMAVSAWPLAPNGKLDRKALPVPQMVRPLSNAFLAPTTPTECALAEIWSQLLQVSPIGLQDNFLELGGSSLLVQQMLTRAREVLRLELSFADFFKEPTIAHMLACARQCSLVEAESIVHATHEKPDEQKPLALSAAQESFWYLEALMSDGTAYINPTAVRMKGRLDFRALEQSFQEIIQEHSILRTGFVFEHPKPKQLIFSRLPFHLEHEHLANEQDVQQLVDEARRPFDLTRPPLLRAKVWHINELEHVLLVSMHHIISDGWSIRMFLDLLWERYNAITSPQEQTTSTMPEGLAEMGEKPASQAPLQYIDYTLWQAKRLQTEEVQAQLEYWKQKLLGAPQVLSIPTDYPRPASFSFRGRRLRRHLAPQLVASLRSLSQQQSATLFMTIVSAYAIVLARYSGQDDFLIGTPSSGRIRPELEKVLGPFVNSLVLRMNLADNPAFLTFLQRVKESCLEGYAHQELPHERVFNALAPERDLSRTPLFQAMMVQNIPLPARQLTQAEVIPYTVDNLSAKVDLTLFLEESTTTQDVFLILEYCTDLFEAATCERLLDHLEQLLESIVKTPLGTVHELPLLTAEQQRQVLVDWNQRTPVATNTEACESLHAWFEAQVARRPTAIALTYEGEHLTYTELNRRANQWAHFLRRRGVKPETAVGLYMERSLDLIVAMLAILKAGGTYVPIDPSYPRERITLILQDAQPLLVLTQSHLLANVSLEMAEAVCLDRMSSLVESEDCENVVHHGSAEQLAYVIYTSGSTGKPKGVMVSHQNVMRLLQNTACWYHFAEDDVWTLFHSYAFDFSVWEIWGALLYGGRLVIVPYETSRSPEDFYHLLCHEHVTVVNQTPTAFRQLSRTDEAWQSVGRSCRDCAGELALRLIIFGGEALDLSILQGWMERHGDQKPQIVNMYGITETTVHVTYRPLQLSDLAAGYGSVIGLPLPDLSMYVLDKYLQPVPVGVIGELYIGGAGVARGYLKRPELTGERFIPHPFSTEAGARLYRSGDLARFLANGDLEYIGRGDTQVKIRGFRIELGEIEAVLARHAAVRECLVVVNEEQPENKHLVAYIIPRDGHIPGHEELRQSLKAHLPEYMLPAAFLFLQQWPMTTHGKIDLRALPRPEATRERLHMAYTPPVTPVEQQLARIWAEVLRIDRVGLTDNFFALGGDSILSLQVIVKAREAHLHFTLRQFLQYQTIGELAQVVKDSSPVMAVEEVATGSVPLMPIAQWFLDFQHTEPHYYNQSLFLSMEQRPDTASFQQALNALVASHESLRTYLKHEQDQWQLEISPQAYEVHLETYELAHLSEQEQREMILAVTGRLQAQLNLEQGPLLRAALFHMQHASRVFLVIHHLAVDGVSWHTLLGDLQLGYQQQLKGCLPALPPRSTSYQRWAERLREYATSAEANAERDYWLSIVRRSVDSFPLDSGTLDSFGLATHEDRYTCILNAEHTGQLLREVPSAYHTQIGDVLLTALAQAYMEWSGNATLSLNLEGHGREPLFEDVDLSRTSGWFTSIYPVVLSLDKQNDNPGQALRSIKEQLRQIPHHGIGYGILRYLHPDAELRTQLAQAGRIALCFNYQGQFDQLLSASSLFIHAEEATASDHSPRNQRTALLTINAEIVNERLEVNWLYSTQHHRRQTIADLASLYLKKLRQIIDYCASPEAGGYTPSDFPLAHLDEQKLQDLLTQIEHTRPTRRKRIR